MREFSAENYLIHQNHLRAEILGEDFYGVLIKLLFE